MEWLGLQFSRTTSSRVSHRQPFFVTGKVAVVYRNAHKSPNTKKNGCEILLNQQKGIDYTSILQVFICNKKTNHVAVAKIYVTPQKLLGVSPGRFCGKNVPFVPKNGEKWCALTRDV